MTNNSRNTHLIFKKKKSNKDDDNQMSVPCVNCGDFIDMDEVEKHSNSCLYVQNDVLESMNNNSNMLVFNTKLKKLDECICKNKKHDNKDSHYYISLSEYINTTMSKYMC